jgi:putative phosphoesterase
MPPRRNRRESRLPKKPNLAGPPALSTFMTKIGVISDTHNFLDPQVLRLLKGVDHILHAGDIGQSKLISDLRRIAPVTAVLGNTDEPNSGFAITEVVTLAGKKFLIHHIVNPRSPGDEIKSRIAREKPEVVVFGHTHKPFCETIGSTLYFNPGAAGKARFGLERTLAILHCEPAGLRPEFLTLG